MLYTVGDFLKNIRTERGISLEQVSNATHIKIRFLEALESNHYGMLPSDVQAKGFLRLYAGFLNISEYPLIEAWTNRGSLRVTRISPDGEELQLDEEVFGSQPLTDADIGTDTEVRPTNDFQPGVENESSDQNVLQSTTEVDFSAVSEQPPTDEGWNTAYPETTTNVNPTSRDIFRELGLSLKNQREALGLTLEEIERYTRIRSRNLETIENGQIDRLPSPVQGQGMLKNYARFLEMDQEKLLSKYADGLQTNRLEKMAELEIEKLNKKRSPLKKQAAWRQFITPDLLIGSSLILVLLVISIWSVAQVSGSRAKNLENIVTPPSIAEVLQITPSFLPPILTETAMAAVTPTRRHSDYDQTTGNLYTNDTQNDLELDSGLPPFENNDPLQLYIIPNQRAWIRITADDEVTFDGRVVPGNTYQYSAQNHLNLLSGNAAALTVYYNQQNLGELGIVGQVLDMDFTVEGIKTPTLIPSATATEGPDVTDTPALPTSTPATPTITPFIP